MFSKQKLCRIQSGVYLDRFSTSSHDNLLKKPGDSHQPKKRLPPAISKYSLQTRSSRLRPSSLRRDPLKDLQQYIKTFSSQKYPNVANSCSLQFNAPLTECDKPLPPLPYLREKVYSLAPTSKSWHLSGCGSEKEWLEFGDLTALPTEKQEKYQLPYFSEQPPDGGTLAWLHVFAGHLVILNAQ